VRVLALSIGGDDGRGLLRGWGRLWVGAKIDGSWSWSSSSARKYGAVDSGDDGYGTGENVTDAVEETGWWCAERVEGKRANCGEDGDDATTVGMGVLACAICAGWPPRPISTESSVVGFVETV
jgi:hypothetical protein